MAGVHGERLYGYVDRVPGLFFVASKFFHFNFVPIFPLGSFLVLEKSLQNGPKTEIRIPMSWKSVFVGYFRGWVGLITFILFIIAGGEIHGLIKSEKPPQGILVLVFVCAAIIGLSIFWTVIGWNRTWIITWGIVLAASGAYLYWESTLPPPPKQANPFKPEPRGGLRQREKANQFVLTANACLLALSVLRQLDRASLRRTRELCERLGWESEQIDALMDHLAGASNTDDMFDQNWESHER